MNTTMNTVNQVFDWKRFTATLRKEFTENWRSLATITLCVYLWYSLTLIIDNIIEMNGHVSFNPYMFTLVAAIMASLAFRRLGTKNGRVSLLSSPSSTAEKFISNILIYVVSAFVIFAVCFQLADVTRYVVMSFLNANLGIESVAPTNFIDFFKNNSGFVPELRVMFQSIFFEILFVGTIFFLGSILWPRRSVIKTASVLLVITLVKMIILVVWAYNTFGEGIDTIENTVGYHFLANAFRINLYVDIVFFVLCWVLAWITLKRKDVISLKWWK